MQPIRVDEALWRSNMAPQGLLERWRARDGQSVSPGQAVAEVRIEHSLHEILAPSGGLLVRGADEGALVAPGERLGWVGKVRMD